MAAAVLLLLLFGWWGKAERKEFEARVAALRASGQPVCYEDLETPPVPDDQNGAKPFAAAAKMLTEREGTEPFSFVLAPPEGYRETLTPEEREGRRAYLRSLKPYFDLLAEAGKRPHWHVDDDWTKGSMWPTSFEWIADAGTYLAWKVALDPDDRGWAECAADATILSIDLGERYRAPFILGELPRYVTTCAQPAAFLRMACGSPSISQGPQPGFDAVKFRRLVDGRLAKAVHEKGPSRAALAEERVWKIWEVRALSAGEKTPLDEWLPFQGRLLKSPLWRPFLYRDANRALDVFEEAIRLAETSPEEALHVAQRFKARRRQEDQTCFLTKDALASVANAFEREGQLVAVHRLTRVVMALLAYHQEKGAWPETLDALGEMPLDPYSGKPFLYEHLETCFARVRAAKEIVGRTGKRLGEWDEWQSLELDDLAWIFKDG